MKTNMSILSIATALLLSTAACSNSASIDDTPRPADQGTGNGAQLLDMSKAEVFTGNNMAPSTIIVDPALQFQTMDGFGFAITYSTCYNLLKMQPEERTAFLKQTYSETEGYGVSYARISIGCNDFSSTEYSLCDEPGLDNFRLYSDETQYVIPVLKEILAINPNVKIIAAPWTCPKWMKVSDIDTKKPFDSWTDGTIVRTMPSTSLSSLLP